MIGPSIYLFRFCQAVLTYTHLDPPTSQTVTQSTESPSCHPGLSYCQSISDARLICVGILRSLFSASYFQSLNVASLQPAKPLDSFQTASSTTSTQQSTAFNVPALPRQVPREQIRIAQVARIFAGVAIHDNDSRIRTLAISSLISLPVSMKGLKHHWSVFLYHP